jgi:hypothetical protein
MARKEAGWQGQGEARGWIVKIFVSLLRRMEVGNLVGPERMQECVKAGGTDS